MTPDLQAVADAMVPGWENQSYMKYEFANGDLVFWKSGALWPFYVDSRQGYGLLVGQDLVGR